MQLAGKEYALSELQYHSCCRKVRLAGKFTLQLLFCKECETVVVDSHHGITVQLVQEEVHPVHRNCEPYRFGPIHSMYNMAY